MFRPFITAVIEYVLAYYVFKNGKYLPKIISLLLFTLASYQFGELVFLSSQSDLGIKIAYFSTSLLPPFGLLIAEKLANKKFGYPVFLLTSIFFACLFLFRDGMVFGFQQSGLFIQVGGYDEFFGPLWIDYYFVTLMLSIIVMGVLFIREKNIDKKNIYLHFLLGYFSFFPTSVIFVNIFHMKTDILASLMCALALIAAVFFAKASLGLSWSEIRNKFKNIKLNLEFLKN